MRLKKVINGIFLISLCASSMTYAAGGSLWGDLDTNSEVSDAAPEPSTAPVITDEVTSSQSTAAPVDPSTSNEQAVIDAESLSTPFVAEPATTPAADKTAPAAGTPAPSKTAPTTKATTTPQSKTKSTNNTQKSAVNNTKKTTKKTSTTTTSTNLNDIDAIQVNPNQVQQTPQQTICDVLMQQPNLKSDPLYESKIKNEIAQRAKIVDDEYAFLLLDPVMANTLYMQYRELYLKTNCTQ